MHRFEWSGTLDSLTFDARVAEDAPDTTVQMKCDAMVEGVVVAPLRMDLEVCRNTRLRERSADFKPAARTAFASYASADRDVVGHRVSALEISAGIDIFQDCLSLRPGEEWKTKFSEEIRRRDLFLLFWSQSAAKSPWVEWEWTTAVEEKPSEALQLHPLEPVEESLISSRLAHLHFNDPRMIVRDYFAQKVSRP